MKSHYYQPWLQETPPDRTENNRRFGIQYYDLHSHAYLWLGTIDRNGYPEFTFATKQGADDYIDEQGLERLPRWQFLNDAEKRPIRSEFFAIEVPE